MNARKTSDKPLVLVTGCSGLIGSRLIDMLSHGYRVVGLDVHGPDPLPAGVSFEKCDLTRDASVETALRRIQADHGDRIASVVHLAAYYDFSGEPSPLYRELTVEGTRRLLRGLSSFTAEQFIFSSTILAMRPSDDGSAISEASPTEATWDYPASKLETEAVIEQERGAVPSVVLRLAGVYDDFGRSPAITEHVRRIHGKDLTGYFFPGDAGSGQAFVHIEDAVSAIGAAIARRHLLSSREIFLIAEPGGVPYETLQEVIGEEIHGQEWPTIRIPKPVAKVGAWVRQKVSPEGQEPFIKPFMVDLADDDYPIDISHARDRLDWSPSHRLVRELPRIIACMRADPERWYGVNDMKAPEGSFQREDERSHAQQPGSP